MMLAALGWIGTVLYLANHALLSFGRLERSRLYYGVNGAAALLVTVNSLALASWQAVVVNGFWVLASAVGFFDLSLARLPGVTLRHLVLVTAMVGIAGAAAVFVDMTLAIRVVGWAGTILFCGSYLLFATARVGQRDYLASNAVAAFLLVPVLVIDQNWPVVALELVWGLLSFAGWVRTPSEPDPQGRTELR